jgi:hypothetical protein
MKKIKAAIFVWVENLSDWGNERIDWIESWGARQNPVVVFIAIVIYLLPFFFAGLLIDVIYRLTIPRDREDEDAVAQRIQHTRGQRSD